MCDACNAFYKPQLEAELSHAVLGKMIDVEWKNLIAGLLAHELGELIAARQGFLLRVGRHSGAESVTLDGLRDIKILGKKGDPPTYRANTTEKRFASLTKAGADGLLPFGWIWIDACDDAHRHLSDDLCQKLATRSALVCEAHRAQLLRLEESQQQRAAAAVEAEEQRHAAEVASRAKADAEIARQAALATMSLNLRRIEEFNEAFDAHANQLRGNKDNPNTKYHDMARSLAREAAAWNEQAEKIAAADAIEEWLPRVVRVDMKDERKKLKLAALRGLI